MKSFGARSRALGGLSALLTLLVSSGASALNASQAQEVARAGLAAAAAQAQRGAPALRSSVTSLAPAERVAAGELMLRTRDFDRAAEEFNKVLELFQQGKVPEATYADALFLLGETYLKSQQHLSARRCYQRIVEQGSRRPFDTYAGRALSRLVDIAWRREDKEGLDYIFAHMGSLPASDDTGSVQYARAKAFFLRKDYASSKSSVGGLPATSEFAHQAQYLLGVVLAKEAAAQPVVGPSIGSPTSGAPGASTRFAPAIDQFRRVTRMPADSAAHRHVVDLAWMAIARLFYEGDNYTEAAEAYGHVDRTSPEFSTMLFELSWVWVRLGDYERAQRSLEVLSITDPGSLKVADGALLRADLMLRSGQFDRALAAYESVRDRFDPLRDQVERFLTSNTDPAVYYDKLTAEEFAAGGELSPLVLDWAREESTKDNVFSVIDDVTRSRSMLKRTGQLAQKLRGVLNSTTRAKAFPELKAALEQTLGALNKIGMARYNLALGMDDVASDNVSGELATVRRERRALMRRASFLPVTDGDFARRETLGEAQWTGASQQLQRLTLEIDRLRAIVNGLRRVLQDSMRGVSQDPATRDRFREEIAANERDLEVYETRVKGYQEAVEMGRAQIGFGDQRYVEDDQVRSQLSRLFEQEVALVASGQDPDAVDYARAISGMLAEARSTESQLAAVRGQYERQAEESSVKLIGIVNDEANKLENYAINLEGLDQQARLLVGEVAMKNFGLVRDRLKNLVLKANVGIVQQAWEVREEQRVRVRNLQRERAREEQNLNDELREVLDDAEEEQ
ncbi:MAG: tetratricopeptide repeat protein [Polyangiaceae bacterium]|nr:tetratricopeptide repeat protein [Polyangiaceae bacterium]